jgi:demethylmenaquinone methyltransferase/2-methoxy-6-polyprenyl-1,4-benzoquinol methylase
MTEHRSAPAGAADVPHQPLREYYEGEAQRAGFVREMFDTTAADYDRMEGVLGLGTGVWYRGQALLRAGLAPGMRVVDVGTGTGLVAREAARIAGDPALVVGVDPSPGMMAEARVPGGVRLVEGTAESIPFGDDSFDFLSMGYALRHLSDLTAAFREFHRVLRPGGRLCILEITMPEGRVGRALLKFYMKGIVPTIAMAVARRGNTRRLWRYYWDTIEACVPPAHVLESLRAAGFRDVRRHVELKAMGIFSEFRATK